MPSLPSVAVIADIHFHDLDASFDFPGISIDGRRMAVRSWAETRQSTRVFNESASALHAALADVVARGIRHVVLLGDYSDDGQRETLETLGRILDRHAREHQLSFYALPGNHDIFGPEGRHQTKEFIADDGAGIMVSSDAGLAGDRVIASAGMYCEGYPLGLRTMAQFGYYRQPHYLHWETPFGGSDQDNDRTYEVVSQDGLNRYRLMDASYLVEPEPGLWLMMIDANVFEPRNGTFVRAEEAAFIDSTAAGWNALLRCKPFILDWMTDVAARARRMNKTLLTFSHYPVLDPFDGVTGAECVLFGETNVVRRTPRGAVAEALAQAGIPLHFSGHLHVEGVTHETVGDREVINIAVPSLVAFPPAFKIVGFEGDGIAVETVGIGELALDPDILEAYRREARFAGDAVREGLPAAGYEEYLLHHQRALVLHRYFEKEWPADIVAQISSLTLPAICNLLDGRNGNAQILDDLAARSGLKLDEIAAIGLVDLVVDWYCLRQASQLALDVVRPERRMLYRALAERYGHQPEQGVDGTAASFLTVFLGAFVPFLDRAERGRQRLTLPLAAPADARVLSPAAD